MFRAFLRPSSGAQEPETCWAVNKRQDNKLKNCCIRLVIYLNCTMMHGLTDLKLFLILSSNLYLDLLSVGKLNSSVSIAATLRVWLPKILSSIPDRGGNILYLAASTLHSGNPPTYLFPPNTEAENAWSSIPTASTPLCVFIAWYWITPRQNFTFEGHCLLRCDVV